MAIKSQMSSLQLTILFYGMVYTLKEQCKYFSSQSRKCMENANRVWGSTEIVVF